MRCSKDRKPVASDGGLISIGGSGSRWTHGVSAIYGFTSELSGQGDLFLSLTRLKR